MTDREDSITLQDISAETGFSVVTVSKALTGRKGISGQTRERIREAARRMGYEKPEGKKNKGTETIAVIAPDRFLTVQESLYWSLYQELSRCLSEKKLFGVLEIVSGEDEHKISRPSVLDNPDVGGLIVLGTFNRDYTAVLEEKTEIPLVYLDAQSPSGRWDSVISNSYMGGYEVVNYLLDLGHRDIGFVGTLRLTDSIDDRFLGGQKAMLQRGLMFQGSRIYDDRDRENQEIDGNCIRLDPQSLPTAFFCNCDMAAETLIRKLQTMGKRVPDDISIAGFDNFPTDPLMQDFITSYDIDRKEMVKKAVHTLTHRMSNPDYRNGLSVTQGWFAEKKSAERVGPAVPYL